MAVIAAVEASNGSTLDVQIGDSIALELPDNPSTGYRWRLVTAGEPVCEKTAEHFVAEGSRPGAPGLLRCEFRVLTRGTARIQLDSKRSWSSSVERSFTLDVSARACVSARA
jgi:inhibitor of cysteine peptidase